MAYLTAAEVVARAPALSTELIEQLRALLPPVRRSDEKAPEPKRQAS